ncbi:hypothetical protein ACG83_25680 [Frankia sp. R43]|nr:hypothetical protein ACG83_25680 [Frankia sp. R43]
MSDVPQAPYGEEGDARPVSLIGARIPSSTPYAAELPARDGESDDRSATRAARRRHRRRGDTDEPAATGTGDGSWQDQAFHLEDAAPGGARPTGRSGMSGSGRTGMPEPGRADPPRAGGHSGHDGGDGSDQEPRGQAQRRGRRLPRTPPSAGRDTSATAGGEVSGGGRRAIAPRAARPEPPVAGEPPRRVEVARVPAPVPPGRFAATPSLPRVTATNDQGTAPDTAADDTLNRRPVLRRAATPRAVPPPAPMGRKDPSFPPATSGALANTGSSSTGVAAGPGATGSPGGTAAPGPAGTPRGRAGSGSGRGASGASGASGGRGTISGSGALTTSPGQRPEPAEPSARRGGYQGGTSAPPPGRRPTTAGPRRPGRPSALAPRTPSTDPAPVTGPTPVTGPAPVADPAPTGDPAPAPPTAWEQPGWPAQAPAGAEEAAARPVDSYAPPEVPSYPGQSEVSGTEPTYPAEIHPAEAHPATPAASAGQAWPAVDPAWPTADPAWPAVGQAWPSADQAWPADGQAWPVVESTPGAADTAGDALGDTAAAAASAWGDVDGWSQEPGVTEAATALQPEIPALPVESGDRPGSVAPHGVAGADHVDQVDGELATEAADQVSLLGPDPDAEESTGYPQSDVDMWGDDDAPLSSVSPASPVSSEDGRRRRPSTALLPSGRHRRSGLEPDHAQEHPSAVANRASSRSAWPGQETWADADDDEPWEEIPLRITLMDRAAAVLPGSWRIAVTSLFPYSGTTTLAGVVGLTLAGVRAEPVLGVDLHPGTTTPGFVPPTADSIEIDESRGDNLVSRVGSRGVTTVSDIARQRGSGVAMPPEEVQALIGARRSGAMFDLDVLPIERPAGMDADTNAGAGALVPVDEPVTPGTLRTVLGALAHAYPLILLDAPAAAPLTPTAIRSADAVILVTLATASDLETTLADLLDPQGALAGVGVNSRERLRREEAGAQPGPAVIAAVVSPRRGRPSPRTRTATAQLARYVDAIVRVPYDPRLDPSRGTPVRIPRLRWATRRSYLRLAAETVDALAAMADAEVSAPVPADRPLLGPPSPLAIPNGSTRLHTGDADHPEVPGVSFGDLRPGSKPTRVSGPDRPGGQPPAGGEPR